MGGYVQRTDAARTSHALARRAEPAPPATSSFCACPPNGSAKMQPLLQIEATFNSVKSTPTRLYEWRKCFAEFYDVDGRMRQIDRAHLVDIISLLGPNPIFEKKAGQLKKFLKEDA